MATNPNQYNIPPAPTSDDIFRYRYHHGTNLGSIFVLEKWLSSSMFSPNATSAQSSELEAVKASVNAIGIDATRAKWEAHWQSALTSSDIQYLTSVSCTSIRLPVGYFSLSASFCQGTPFEPYASVYVNAWATIKALVHQCFSNGIGVLLDLHALPGGANGGDHSGTNAGFAGLWNNSANLDLATKCLSFMAQEIHNGSLQAIGLQLCNEADYNAPGMYAWYDLVVANISRIDASIPLYISDGWDLTRCVKYAQGKNNWQPTTAATNPIVIDTHLYWAFSDANKAMSPQQIIADVPKKLSELDGQDGSVVDRGGVQVCVGEYSCVMDGSSWAKTTDDRGQLVKQFGNAECAKYQQRSGGSFFWTFKMDWMPGGEWGFMAQTTGSAVFPPPNLLLNKDDVSNRLNQTASQRNAAFQASRDAHVNYWNANAPGKSFEHWRYEAGWNVGFDDATSFFGARSNARLGSSVNGGDKIGNLDIWARKRIIDSGMIGEFVWEYERKS